MNCCLDLPFEVVFILSYLRGASFISSFISAARKCEEAAAIVQICGDNAVKKAVFEAVEGVERSESLDFLRVSSPNCDLQD